MDPSAGQMPRVAGSERLAPALRALRPQEGAAGLVFDASDAEPVAWSDADAILTDAFLACRAAMAERQPIVLVVHEPSLHGHEPELRSAVATALLGGARSLAVEGRRHDVAVNAVAMADDDELSAAATTVSWLLGQRGLSGQLVSCGSTHLGRPPA